MPAEVTATNGLAWSASIDYSQITEDAKAIQKILSTLGVGAINSDVIAAPIADLQQKVQATTKKINDDQVRIQTEVAQTITKIDNQVYENREKLNMNWSASMDEQMIQLQEYQDQLGKSVIQKNALPIKEEQKRTFGIDKETMSIIESAKDVYAELDQATQEYIQELIELEMQMQKVAAAQTELDDAKKKGNITDEDYAKASGALAAQEKQISDSMDNINQRQKEYDAMVRASIGSIEEKKLSLKQLEIQYEQLSVAEREASIGTELNDKISALKNEIKGLKPGQLQDFALKTVTARTELRKLIDQMASNPNSPMFDEWQKRAVELKESFEEVNRGIQLAASDSSGIDALVDGVRGLVGGFAAATGAVSLFGVSNEEAEKAIQKTMAALAVLNGVQELSRVLEKESALNIYLTSIMRKRDAAATAAQTVATTAQTSATTGAAVATRSLTAAMMANPATALVVGITALVGAYLLFRKRSDEVKTSQELLAEATKEVSSTYAEQQAKIVPYLAALKQGNLTENDRLNIYEKLKAINPSIVDGINAKTLSYDALTKNVRNYLNELKNQMKLESNSKAIQESLAIELDLESRIEKQKQIVELKKKEVAESKKVKIVIGGSSTGVGSNTQDRQSSLAEQERELARLEKAKDRQTKETEKLANASAGLVKTTNDQTGAVKRTVEVIDKEIAEKKKLQLQNSVNSKEWIGFQNEITKLEKEREAITGKTEKTRSSANKVENELNSILEKRTGILEQIAALERDAKQSGMLKQDSEIDRINQKYDEQVLALQKVNAEIEKYNKKNPTRKQELLGGGETARLQAARETELINAQYREEARVYIESLKDKQIAFDVFLQAQESGNTQLILASKEIYKDQLGEYSSYIEMLRGETMKIVAKSFTSPLNIGDMTKLQEFNKQYIDEVAKSKKRETELTLKTFSEALAASATFNDQRRELEVRHQKEIDALTKNYKGADLQNRLAILKEVHAQEIEDVENNAARQTKIYKKMNQDVVRFTREQLKDRLKEMEDALRNDNTLTPEVRQALKSYIDQLKQLIKTNTEAYETGVKLGEIGSKIGNIASALGSISDAAKQVNSDLGSIIESAANAGKLASSALNAASGFATGNIEQGISGTISAIGDIFNNIAAKRQSEKVAQQAVLDFQTRIMLGEMEMNAILAQRERDQVKLNKLKIDGLLAEQKLLEQQAKTTQKTFSDIFTQLQKENFISGQGTKEKKNWTAALLGGALGSLGTSRTEVVDQYASLMGKTFDDIEKLYLQGRLTPKALELFEQLKKIKQEGADIDALLQQNAESLRQVFTGTSSDAILDSIVDGFKNGLRSAQDFADTFEQLMQNAVLNALKYQVLEQPLKEFYEAFAADAQSDSVLTDNEILQLKNRFDLIIGNAGKSFEELQKITNIDFNNPNSTQGKGLTGAIKGITEQQADLLAGQFGGLRLTAIEILKFSTEQLSVMNDIRTNTSFIPMQAEFIESSNAVLKDIQLNGIKVK
jgi:hypothetical protein